MFRLGRADRRRLHLRLIINANADEVSVAADRFDQLLVSEFRPDHIGNSRQHVGRRLFVVIVARGLEKEIAGMILGEGFEAIPASAEPLTVCAAIIFAFDPGFAVDHIHERLDQIDILRKPGIVEHISSRR